MFAAHAAPGATPPPLDVIPTAPFAAWSFARKLRTAYAGKAFNVFNGTTTADIGFIGNAIDTAALTSFVGANTGRIVTAYDHGANTNDVTQGTAGQRPRIVNSGTLDTLNGRLTAVFDVARNDSLSKGSVASTATAWTFLMVVEQNLMPNTTYHGAFGWGSDLSGANNMGMLINGGKSADWFEGDFSFLGNGYTSGNAPRVISRMGVMDARDDAPVVYSGVVSASRVLLRRNGRTMRTRVATVGAPGVSGTKTLSLGSANGGFYWPGNISECYIFPADIGDPALFGLENNCQAFFNAIPIHAAGMRGIDSDYINCGQILQYEYTQAWSYITPVRINGKFNGAQIFFTTVGDGVPVYRGYECWIDTSAHAHVRIMHDFGANQYIGVSGGTNLADGNNHVVLFTYSGSGTAAGVKIYVDGVLETLTTESDTLGGLTIVNTKDFIVGNQIDVNVAGYYLEGRMYAMELANVVRDQTWATAHASLATFPAPDANSQLSYDFSTGTGTTVTDNSGNGRNGTLTTPYLWLDA